MNQQIEEGIDIKELIVVLLEHWKLIVLGTLVAGILTFSAVTYLVTPEYEASISMYVNNSTGAVNSDITTSSDLTASQQLAETYITILQSNSILEAVAKQMDSDITASMLKPLCVASRLNNTEVIQITVTNEDPVMAARLADAFAVVCPEMLADYVEASSVKIIDHANIPKKPSSPDISRDTAIGLLLGLILCCAFVIIREMLDVHVKSEEDLRKAFDLPVLGIIPVIEPQKEAKE